MPNETNLIAAAAADSVKDKAQAELPEYFHENKAILFEAMSNARLCSIETSFNVGLTSLDADHAFARATPDGDEVDELPCVMALERLPNGNCICFTDTMLNAAQRLAESLFPYLCAKYEPLANEDDADLLVSFILDQGVATVDIELLKAGAGGEKITLYSEKL